MYMYYLLGYKIMELPISDERKEVRLGLGGRVQGNCSGSRGEHLPACSGRGR